MKLSNEGKNLIKEHEGLRLNAYLDPIGIPTIGYGHTKSVRMGQRITLEKADYLLDYDSRTAENAVNKYIIDRGIPLLQHQYDALVSLVFNVGAGNIFTKDYGNGYPFGSRLYNKILAKDYSGAGKHFTDFNKAGGKILNGLVKRRKEEQDLFLKKKVGLCPSCCRPL